MGAKTQGPDRNRFTVLNAIREKGPLARAELSRVCGMSIAGTKRLVDDLVSGGFLMEAETGERPGRGRRPALLRFNGRHGYAIGLSIEPHALEVQAESWAGESLFKWRVDPGTERREIVEERIGSAVRQAMESCAIDGSGPLLGIGAGIAGLVNARAGVVLYCPGLPGWENADLASFLRLTTGTDAVVDDAVRCMALAEKRYGAARDVDTFLFVYIGAGVGAGIVLDGRIYRGTHGVSGEFGHITIREDGPLCKCGNRGCLEALVSTDAILARVEESLAAGVYSSLRDEPGRRTEARGLSLGDVCAAATAGDKLANMLIAETEENIGIGVSNLINVLDPGTVILSGEVIGAWHQLILEGTRRIVGRRALHSIAHRTSIRRSAFDVDTAARGAAAMVIERELRSGILNL